MGKAGSPRLLPRAAQRPWELPPRELRPREAWAPPARSPREVPSEVPSEAPAWEASSEVPWEAWTPPSELSWEAASSWAAPPAREAAWASPKSSAVLSVRRDIRMELIHMELVHMEMIHMEVLEERMAIEANCPFRRSILVWIRGAHLLFLEICHAQTGLPPSGYQRLLPTRTKASRQAQRRPWLR